jgi:3-oxoacyl-[acyl-carrier protein] reductase
LASYTFDFTGRTALVTGAGAGCGRAIALALAQAGASVLVNDLNPDRAESVAEEITTGGGRATANQGDVANRFQAANMIEEARAAYGLIHILVNAAGAFKRGEMLLLDEWDWRRLVDVNLTGSFFCTQLVSRVMADAGGGIILNISAAVGQQGSMTEGVAYTATKAGLLGLTRQSARELAPYNIRVNAVCPGGFAEDDMPAAQTERLLLGQLVASEDVAAAAIFLCSDLARLITGQALVIDGGTSLT